MRRVPIICQNRECKHQFYVTLEEHPPSASCPKCDTIHWIKWRDWDDDFDEYCDCDDDFEYVYGLFDD